MPVLGLSTGEAILLIALVSIPVAALAFALGARGALRQVGRGPLSIEQEPAPRQGESAPISAAARADEVRQMVEAKAYRQRTRGEHPVDVEAEVERLLDDRPASEEAGPAAPAGSPSGGADADPELAAEVRQLVVASNERRERRGEEPLDVEAEVERRLRELTG